MKKRIIRLVETKALIFGRPEKQEETKDKGIRSEIEKAHVTALS